MSMSPPLVVRTKRGILIPCVSVSVAVRGLLDQKAVEYVLVLNGVAGGTVVVDLQDVDVVESNRLVCQEHQHQHQHQQPSVSAADLSAAVASGSVVLTVPVMTADEAEEYGAAIARRVVGDL